MKKVYSSIETASQWLTKTNITQDKATMGNYSILQDNLIKGFEEIQKINLNKFIK